MYIKQCLKRFKQKLNRVHKRHGARKYCLYLPFTAHMGVDNSLAHSAKQAAEHCTVFHSVNSINLQMPVLNPHGSGFQDNSQTRS